MGILVNSILIKYVWNLKSTNTIMVFFLECIDLLGNLRLLFSKYICQHYQSCFWNQIVIDANAMNIFILWNDSRRDNIPCWRRHTHTQCILLQFSSEFVQKIYAKFTHLTADDFVEYFVVSFAPIWVSLFSLMGKLIFGLFDYNSHTVWEKNQLIFVQLIFASHNT